MGDEGGGGGIHSLTKSSDRCTVDRRWLILGSVEEEQRSDDFVVEELTTT